MHMLYMSGMSDSKTLPYACQQSLADHLRPELFKALCDPMRISIVAILAARSGSASVGDITECCGIDFSGVSRHLKILRDAGILAAEKSGREVLYSLKTVELSHTLHMMADALTACEEIVAQQ